MDHFLHHHRSTRYDPPPPPHDQSSNHRLHDFSLSQSISNQIITVPVFHPCNPPPRVLSDNRHSLFGYPILSQNPPIHSTRYDSVRGSTFRTEHVDQKFHRPVVLASNLDGRALSSDFDIEPKFGGYAPIYDLECGTRDEILESNRFVKHRKPPRDLRHSSSELGNREIGDAVNAVKRECYGSKLGRYNNIRGKKERVHEFTRTPKRKSAFLRIQTVKPNHRNCEIGMKDKHGNLGFGMKAEEREGSPVELDISFESNSLVAKAVVAPLRSVVVSNTDTTLVSDTDLIATRKRKMALISDGVCSDLELAKLSTGAVSSNRSPCKASDTSSSGKDVILQKNISDTSSQPCPGDAHNPHGKNEMAQTSKGIVSDETAHVCSGKKSSRVVKKKRIVKKVVGKILKSNSNVSSSVSANMLDGSSTAFASDRTKTSLKVKSATVEKVSIPNGLQPWPSEENHYFPEDKNGNVPLLSLGTHPRSQENTDGCSDLGIERSKSSSRASSNEDKKSDSDCLDANNSAHGVLSMPYTDKVTKSLNVSTSSELGRYNNGRGKRECAHEFTRPPKRKSAFHRIQSVKPNHRNCKIEQLHCTGYTADPNSNSFRVGNLGFGMIAEEREGSPVKLDISFESNSLVAKAIGAPLRSVVVSNTDTTLVSDIDMTPTGKRKKALISDGVCSDSELAKPSTGAVSSNSSPCKASDTSSSGKDMILQKNVYDTSSQPCPGAAHNPHGKADVCSGKTSSRVVKKKVIVKKVVRKVVKSNSNLSSSVSANMLDGIMKANGVTLSSSTAFASNRPKTSLKEKSTTVEKVSILNRLQSLPSEGNDSFPEDKNGDAPLLSLGTQPRSQEYNTDGYFNLGIERSKSSSCASSNEDKKSDSDCLDANNSAHGVLSMPYTEKVTKSLNGSTSSEINHTDDVNKQLCQSEVSLSPGKYSNVGCPQNEYHVGDEMNCSVDNVIDTCNPACDRVAGLSSNDLTAKSEENFTVCDIGNGGIVGKVYCENESPTLSQDVILKENPDIAITVPSSGIVDFSSLSKTTIQDGLDFLQHASVLKQGSNNESTNSEDSITFSHCGIMNDTGKQVPPSNVIVSPENCDTQTFPNSNISVGYGERDTNKIKKRKVGTYINCSHLKMERMCPELENPVSLANVAISNTEIGILALENIKGETIDLQDGEENYCYNDFVQRSPSADMESNDLNVQDDLLPLSCMCCPANGDGVTTGNSNDDFIETLPDAPSDKCSQGITSEVLDRRMLVCLAIDNEDICGDGSDSRSMIEQGFNSDHATGHSNPTTRKIISQPSQVYSEVTSQHLKSDCSELIGSKNRPGCVIPKTLKGHSAIFSKSKTPASSTSISNSQTWHHRGNNSPTSLPASKPSVGTVPPKRPILEEKGNFLNTSYIHKSNSLVRKPTPVSDLSQMSFANWSPSLGLDGFQKSLRSESRVDVTVQPNLLKTGLTNGPLKEQIIPPLPIDTKLEENRTSPLIDNLSIGCCENATDPRKVIETNDAQNSSEDALKYSETPDSQTCPSNNGESQVEANDGNMSSLNAKRIIYIKPKSNQLVATSNLCDISVSTDDKAQTAYSDDYYKRSKNQLVRTSLVSHISQTVAMLNSNINSDGLGACKVLCNRRFSKRRSHKASGSLCKPLRGSLVWTLKNSSKNDIDSGNYQKVLPQFFPWKRGSFLRNFIRNPASISNSSSLSAISKKLLLLRKRNAVYARSTNGFSLWKSKVSGIGGSSLKWSKSIERHSRKAYEEDTHAVERKKREQKDPSCITSQAKREGIFRIGSVCYRMDPFRRTLQRFSGDDESLPSASNLSGLAAKEAYIPRKLLIGKNEYVRIGKGNQLIRDPKKRTQILANEKVRWSLHTARQRLTRKQNHCQFFTKFGKCNKDNGKCPYIHDPSKIAVCTRFLNGLCSNPNCKLTHKVIPERMADCSYFLQGLCTNRDCPYRHVNVNPKASICEGFLKGYCADGNECQKKHSYVCPTFEATENCNQGTKCKLHHPKQQGKGKKRKISGDQNRSIQRYFGSIDVSEPAIMVAQRQWQQNNENEGEVADYISFEVDGVAKSVDQSYEQATLCDSDPLDLQLDNLDELIKPVVLMKKNLWFNHLHSSPVAV